MSIRDFAAHLGVSDRMISRWEAAGDRIQPRPVNQGALDTSLNRATEHERERFVALLRSHGFTAARANLAYVSEDLALESAENAPLRAGSRTPPAWDDPPAGLPTRYDQKLAEMSGFDGHTGWVVSPLARDVTRLGSDLAIARDSGAS